MNFQTKDSQVGKAMPAPGYYRIDGGDTTFMIHAPAGEPPHVVYWGKRLPSSVSPMEIEQLNTRHRTKGAEFISHKPSLALEPGLGLLGAAGLSVHRDGKDWGTKLVVENVEANNLSITLLCLDNRTRLRVRYELDIDSESGLLTIGSSLTNHGDSILDVENMATACLPVQQRMTDIIGFTGRWSGEFHPERFSRQTGTYMRENRRGRTSHDSFPGLFLCATDTTEEKGEVYGFHLAWSGNHRLRVDTLRDGRVLVSMGALFFPGEIRIEPGNTFESPSIIAGYSHDGLSALSRGFHSYVRTRLLRTSVTSRPRPVHYNTWEAVYFNHDVETFKRLADKAAEIGVERFVLDDGWFGARRDKTAGLGDWLVSDEVYPNGLKPLVDHVRELGIEMGIWFEPEMVNANSNLYRTHPDWVLELDGVDQIPSNHQLVLDISRPEVSDYLFNQIDAILRDHEIGYIKWDQNRDLHHPGEFDGHAKAIAQVPAAWALIERVREAHPTVEIESCSSGGARADFGILKRTDRIWPSDSTDALDRQAIQRGASYFLPLNVIGAHVGPSHCHQTGRTLSMEMRAATALFGHMGLELNLLEESDEDLGVLREAIDLYKEFRDLLHSGDHFRLNSPDYAVACGVVSTEKTEALYSYSYLTGVVQTHPDRINFVGIDPKKYYRLKMRWPHEVKGPRMRIDPNTAISVLDLMNEGSVLSGYSLTINGLQLPSAFPETTLLFHLKEAR
jgi:alpha-galactosidase